MLRTLTARLRQGHRTIAFPKQPPALAERFRGRPVLGRDCAGGDCSACAAACPVEAVVKGPRGPRIDLGKCLFCTACTEACPNGALSFSRDYRMAARRREDLWIDADKVYCLAEQLDRTARALFGRSLRLRQVSAGGCNGCEVEINVLSTVVYDLSRFGIQIVASPRHADGLWITGPITKHMRLAVEKTYAAMPHPKLVIASGACAISGGPFAGMPEVLDGAAALLPVDLLIPGCPPHPVTVLDGLLRLLGRLTKAPASDAPVQPGSRQ